MAIKTKKITDLGTINIQGDGAGSLNDTDFFLIGCKSGITGKVEVSALVNSISQHVNSLVSAATEAIAVSSTNDSDEVEKIKNEVKSISNNLNDLFALVNGISSTPTPSCDCDVKIAALEAKVAALEAKVAALEGFVQALQAEGYLTLANIKKAAAEACPICTHTHEEEQSAE